MIHNAVMNSEEQTQQLAITLINHLKNKTRDTWVVKLYNGDKFTVKAISATYCQGSEGTTSTLTYFNELLNQTDVLDLFHVKEIA